MSSIFNALDDFLAAASKGKMQQANFGRKSLNALVSGKKPAGELDIGEGSPLFKMAQDGRLVDKLNSSGLAWEVRYPEVLVAQSPQVLELLKAASTPAELGKLYGYSPEDIAAFYLKRRGGNPDVAFAEYTADIGSLGDAKSILDYIGKPVKELVNEGYPAEVAERISSGKLPMDEASRTARADAMSDPRVFYHGGDKGITEFDPAVSASKKTEGTGVWVSDDPILANTYLPPEEGMLYPLRILTDGMYKVDAKGRGWNDIENPLGGTVTTDQLAKAASKSGEPGVIFENIVDPGPNFKMAREAKDDFIDWRIKHEESGATNMSVNDPTRIRSVNAAFDPEYKGPNILGSLAALGVGGAALNSQDASAVESGMPMAMQAAGQSSMDVDPGRDFGNAATILDFLLPLVAETVKPQMMGNAELTDEQRRRGYYNGM